MSRGNLLMLMNFISALSLSLVCRAQALSTASRTLQPSVFVLLGDNYTGLGNSSQGLGGRNLSLTAVIDLGFYTTHNLTLSAEARGVYPLFEGEVDGEKSILTGLRLQSYSTEREGLKRISPYLDVLGGRGEQHYVHGGYPTPGALHIRSVSSVYGLGFGLEFPLTEHFGLIGDAQFLHWDTPVTSSGVVYSKHGSAGVAYHFGRGSAPRR